MDTTGYGPSSYIDGLKRAIIDEKEAAEFYKKLASLAPNRAIAGRIMDIQEDELYHYQILCGLLNEYPNQATYGPAPNKSFPEGVSEAYQDEVGAVEMYASLSLMAPDYPSSARLRDIMRDETVHAEFFAELLACPRY